jgi:hypothetical protein
MVALGKTLVTALTAALAYKMLLTQVGRGVDHLRCSVLLKTELGVVEERYIRGDLLLGH